MDYKEMKFKTWEEAVSFAIKNKLWGKVTVVLEGDYYVICDKR